MSNWRRCVFPLDACLLPPSCATHFKSSRRQLVQGIPSCATLQRTFLARQYWHAFEAIFLAVRRASYNSAARIGLLVVDGGVPGMAAALVPLRSTVKQCLLVHRPHIESQSTRVKILLRDSRDGETETGKQVGRRIKPLVSKEQMTKAERRKQTRLYFEEARLLNR